MSNEHLSERFETASRDVKKALVMRQGGQAAENSYSSAYQAMVRAGQSPQLRKRYRSAKASKSVRK